ncbi:hypothetical protein RhiirB3_533249 [Rhizophagus irregularis]|nr:hypothetical protein RhiirB3_533249 [Rhizophagus irregularis]
MQVLTENGNINWSTLYDQHIDMINDAPQDLLGQPVDEEEVYDEDSEDELPFEEDKMRMRNNIDTTGCSSRRWDPKRSYIAHPTLVLNASNSGILDGREVDIDSIDYQKLNENQKNLHTNRITLQ